MGNVCALLIPPALQTDRQSAFTIYSPLERDETKQITWDLDEMGSTRFIQEPKKQDIPRIYKEGKIDVGNNYQRPMIDIKMGGP